MSDDPTKTVRIKRTSKVMQDDRGHNVWVGRVEAAELELVSTMALQQVLKSGGGEVRTEIRKLARSHKDGVLARDTATGHYRIVSEAELKSFAAAGSAGTSRPQSQPTRTADVTGAPISAKALRAADELSLVSTQILRKVVKASGGKDPSGGFDPYNKG
jgi:hypothetical protein